jgi:dTDP-4-amino-4,6-dideoxygalactose transaminase
MSYYKKKYGYKPKDFPIAERIGASTITIPLYPKLTSSEISYVVRAIHAATMHTA